MCGAAVRFNEPLSKHTSMRVGGPADAMVEVESEVALRGLLLLCARHGVPLMVLGGGTNLIVRDGGWRGIAARLSGEEFVGIEVKGERISAGAGARLSALVEESVQHALSGLEGLAGIPGTVGGAVRMNAGAHGVSIGDAVEMVRLMDSDGTVRAIEGREMGFEYRGCRARGDSVVVSVDLKLRQDDRDAVEKRYTRYRRDRDAWLPREPNAGCVFKNPPCGPTAGELMDSLELKGVQQGGAAVCERHANVIINRGGACGRDVIGLMERMRDRVREARGVALEPEVVVVGEDTACSGS